MCKFSGLVRFPFDHLVCGIEIGGWSWSGGYQGIALRDGIGYSFSSQELTQGTSYQVTLLFSSKPFAPVNRNLLYLSSHVAGV